MKACREGRSLSCGEEAGNEHADQDNAMMHHVTGHHPNMVKHACLKDALDLKVCDYQTETYRLGSSCKRVVSNRRIRGSTSSIQARRSHNLKSVICDIIFIYFHTSIMIESNCSDGLCI